jgi:hypothetical protein
LILVRLLLFAALAAVGAAFVLWLVKRDRRYLRFIGLTLKFAVLMLLAILLWYAAERLLAPVPKLSNDTRRALFRLSMAERVTVDRGGPLMDLVPQVRQQQSQRHPVAVIASEK